MPLLRYTPVLSEPSLECDWVWFHQVFIHQQVLKNFKSLKDFEGVHVVVSA